MITFCTAILYCLVCWSKVIREVEVMGCLICIFQELGPNSWIRWNRTQELVGKAKLISARALHAPLSLGPMRDMHKYCTIGLCMYTHDLHYSTVYNTPHSSGHPLHQPLIFTMHAYVIYAVQCLPIDFRNTRLQSISRSMYGNCEAFVLLSISSHNQIFDIVSLLVLSVITLGCHNLPGRAV